MPTISKKRALEIVEETGVSYDTIRQIMGYVAIEIEEVEETEEVEE